MSDLNLLELQKSLPFWDKLSSSEQLTLSTNTSLCHYPAGSIIHSGELDCIGILLVKTGSLRVYMLSENGREITLYRIGDSDVCILSAACVLDAITFDVSISAITDCDILTISSPAFSSVMQENMTVELFAYKTATERFSEVMWAMQQILFLSFDKRLAIFLLDETAQTGGNTLSITHEQIAQLMGSAREVVTRMLKYFSKEGYVSLSRGTVTLIDRKALQNLAYDKD